jgi:SulP family sulfate permease
VRGAPTSARWLVLDAEAMVQVDSAGLAAIEQVARDLERDGVTLVVARMRAVTQQRFDEGGLADAIGRDRFHPTVRAAVEACLREQAQPG